MTNKEITNYDELQIYIKGEVDKQVNQKRKTAEITLPTKWFFKAAKFIQFILKDDPDEHDARVKLSEECQSYKVRVNGYNTTIKRNDIQNTQNSESKR